MKGAEKKDERHETEKLSDAKQSVAGKDENKSSESAPVGALPTEAAEAGAAAADRDTAAAQSNDAHLEATSAAASKEPGWFRPPVSAHLLLWNMTLPQQSQACTEKSLRNLRRRVKSRLFRRPSSVIRHRLSCGVKSWI